MELKQGRPQEKRIAKEERVYDLLEKLHIDYQRIDHEKADTMEICLEIEKSLQATICKNLFLVNSNKSQYYLLMLKEHKKFKTKNISKQINSSRLSFGSDEKITLRNLLQHFSFYDFIIVDTKQNILFQYNSNDDWFHNLISLKKFYNQEVITVYKKENHFYISIDF